MSVDGRDVRAEVEDTTDARDDPRQRTHARESDRRRQAPRVWEVNDLDRSRLTVLAYGACVGLRVDLLDPVDRARAQVGQDGRPVVRWSIPQPDRDAGRADRALRQCGDDFPAERARRAVEEVLERLVEAPHAAEPRCQGDLGHRQAGVMDQLLREQDASSLGHRHRRGSEVLHEQASEMARADAESLGERIDAGLLAVEGAVGDQREAARHRVRRAVPGAEVRCGLGSAAEAGAEARRLGSGGGGVEPAILEPGGPRRADRPAIDPGGGDAHEEPAVEALVACLERAVAGCGIESVHRSGQ